VGSRGGDWLAKLTRAIGRIWALIEEKGRNKERASELPFWNTVAKKKGE